MSRPINKGLISEDRKVTLFSDVDFLVPDELRKMFSLIDEIIETNKETLSSVYEKIEERRESIEFVYSVIDYALKIRFNSESLLSLYKLLSQKHGRHDIFLNFSLLKRNIPQESEATMFRDDNIDLFIKKSSEIGFDPKAKIVFETETYCPIAYANYSFDSWKSGDNIKLPYLQIMAFYGAVKCFKHACLSNEYDFRDVQKYAVAGGNTEIIHILEQMDVSFEDCLDVSIKFH